MKYYIIAGEASGDIHASHLMHSLKHKDKAAEFRFWGGELMEKEAGVSPRKHYKELAFMGFVEVLANIRTIKKNLDFCKKDILEFQPDVVIFIDYPGFNLRMAKFAHDQKIKTAYYISPQIWAWKENRIQQIKANIDLMLVILPFEEEFYKKHNYKAHFVGHPLLDHMAIETQQNNSSEEAIALLPGSRKQEVKRMLPVMLKALDKAGNRNAIIAATKNLPDSLYKSLIGKHKVEIIYNDMHAVLKKSQAALVTSGTATLETALLKVPQVVCYKAAPISYQIAKRLVRVPYISLVNLIMDKEVVKELIQHDLQVDNLTHELTQILPGGKKYDNMMEDYQMLPQRLGGKGASDRAAQLILQLLN
jgi:lipid-A-disaccharide synthase